LSSDRFDPKTIEQAVRPIRRSADVAVAVKHQEAIVSLHGAPQPRRGPAGQPAPKEKASGGCASSSSSQIGLGPPPARRRDFRRAQNLQSLRCHGQLAWAAAARRRETHFLSHCYRQPWYPHRTLGLQSLLDRLKGENPWVSILNSVSEDDSILVTGDSARI
jgi:hypothetical protein